MMMQSFFELGNDLGFTIGSVGALAALRAAFAREAFGVLQPNLGMPGEAFVVETPGAFAVLTTSDRFAIAAAGNQILFATKVR